MNNPKKSLSLHSYGIAIDLNWDKNQVGTIGNIPLDVVYLFSIYGWRWGGNWENPGKDPMHFEYYQS
jgi:hypothetical protein